MSLRHNHHCQIERWAHFIRDNPAQWKTIHTQFINALFQKHEQFIQRLLASPGGEEKLHKLKELRLKQKR